MIYHHVGVPPPSARYHGLYVAPWQLDYQIRVMKWLGFRFSTLQDAVATNASGKIACLTFDDGFKDNIEVALPILRQHHVPATVFVVAGDVGKTNLRWDEAGETTPGNLMGWAELKALMAAGWEIGSHGQEHRHLALLAQSAQRQNILGSYDVIARELGTPPQTFAYPFGSFDETTLACLRDSPYIAAVSTKAGINWSLDERYRLRRIALKGHRLRHLAQPFKIVASRADLRRTLQAN